MKNITMYKVSVFLLFVTLCLFSSVSYSASELNKPPTSKSVFVGNWTVVKVDFPDNYFSEIEYPKSFQLSQVEGDGRIKGKYKDQYDQEYDFSLSQLINNGHELLLLTYGTTKHSESWAPLHKVKLINGQLVGSVITNTQRFIWYAEPTK